jgi:hypothetical protein
MASYPVQGGKVIGAPPGVQKQFDELMGENRAWAKANQDKVAQANGGKDTDKDPKKDKKGR